MRRVKTVIATVLGAVVLALSSVQANAQAIHTRIFFGNLVHTSTTLAWGMFVVPAFTGIPGSEVAEWVGVQFSDLCQAGIASTMIAPGVVQTSLIAQDWPAPFKATVGPSTGDLVFAAAGKLGSVYEALVVDLTTGQELSVGCESESGMGWPLAEWMNEYNNGQPHLKATAPEIWLERCWQVDGKTRCLRTTRRD